MFNTIHLWIQTREYFNKMLVNNNIGTKLTEQVWWVIYCSSLKLSCHVSNIHHHAWRDPILRGSLAKLHVFTVSCRSTIHPPLI